MSVIDLILNLAALMLWLNWRAARAPERARGAPGMLGATVRRVDAASLGWFWVSCLLLLLGLRGFFYWKAGQEVDWTPSISLGPVVLTFRSDRPDRIFLFSCLSFAFTLGIFYSGLLLLSMLSRRVVDGAPQQKWVALQLGRVERWPRALKLLLPWAALALGWALLCPLLARLVIAPTPQSNAHLAQQALVIGAGAYLAWKYLLAGILLLRIINSYIYLGNSTFWNYLNPMAKSLEWTVSFIPLRLGKFDFAPVLVMVAIFASSNRSSAVSSHPKWSAKSPNWWRRMARILAPSPGPTRRR